MSRRGFVSRVAVAAGALVVLLLGLAIPTVGNAAPLPHATTASASATATGSAKATPSASESDTDVDPADDPTDDGTDPTPDQSGTWIAIGSAAALSLLAGLVVVLRKR